MTTITRRQFLEMSAIAAAAAAMPASSCISLPNYKKITIDYKNHIILKNCNLIDVKQGTVIPESVIIVKKDRIIHAGPISPEAIPQGMVFDCAGLWVTPGFIDSHCHTTLPGANSFDVNSASGIFRQMKMNFVNSIYTGVTTVRDTGSFPKLLRHFIREVKQGELPGPRVVHCNAFLNVNGGHPDIPYDDVTPLADFAMSLFLGYITSNFKNMMDLEKKIVHNMEHGASFIKLTVDNKSAIYGKNATPVYTDEQLKYIFDYAGKKQCAVAAHNLTRGGFERMLGWPLDSYEHIVADEVLSDEAIMKMAKKGTTVIPPLSVWQCNMWEEAFEKIPAELLDDFVENELTIRRKYFNSITTRDADPVIQKTNRKDIALFKTGTGEELVKKKHYLCDPSLGFKVMLNGRKNIQKMREAGVLIGCGTDAGLPMNYFGFLWREADIFSRLGFKNDEILKTITINNAKILRMENDLGSIGPGKLADMVVLGKNPLENVEAYKTPLVIFKDGKLAAQNRELKKLGNQVTISE